MSAAFVSPRDEISCLNHQRFTTAVTVAEHRYMRKEQHEVKKITCASTVYTVRTAPPESDDETTSRFPRGLCSCHDAKCHVAGNTSSRYSQRRRSSVQRETDYRFPGGVYKGPAANAAEKTPSRYSWKRIIFGSAGPWL